MTEQNTQENAIMPTEEAYGLIRSRVYAPAFFTKLAEQYGYQPQTDQEAADMLDMAAQIRYAQDVEEKQAGSNDGLLKVAKQRLHAELANRGIDVANETSTETDLVKQAAVYASHDPALATAFLSLHAQAADAE